VLLLAGISLAQESDYLIVPGQRLGRWEIGKALDTYGFGEPRARWEGKTQDGRVYYDGYSLLLSSVGLSLQAYTCRNDNYVFALLAIRPVNQSNQNTEATKYRTAEGVGIGTDESDATKFLGRPNLTSRWNERHGSIDVAVAAHIYQGLRIHVNQGDGKIFAIGPTTRGEFASCREAVLGKPSGAQATPSVLPRLPVPMPADLRIIPASPDVPAERAGFLGVWVGRWDGTADTGLAVEEISGSTARVVYAWGVTPQWNITQAGWARVRGQFSGRNLFVSPLAGASQITYTLRNNDTIDAFWPGPPRDIRAVLTRVR